MLQVPPRLIRASPFVYVRDGASSGASSPVYTSWFAQQDPFAFDGEKVAYDETARRFESGTPSMPSLYAGEAGLTLLHTVGMATIQEHVQQLATRTIQKALERGLDVLTPVDPSERGPLVVLRCGDARRLVEILEGEGILTSARGNGLRIGLHFYNTPGDVDVLFDVLDRFPALTLPPRNIT